MDLTLDVEDYKLNIRSAGLIIHNNKVLVHDNINTDYYCLPGGRIAIGENSEETIKRELKEELGKEVEVLEYVSTIENFFEMNNTKYHEIYFVHRLEFKDDEDKKIEYTLDNMEGKDYLKYKWLDINEIEEYKILPKCLKQVIKDAKFPVHCINDDLINKE